MRVSVVSSVCVRRDAISESVRGTIRALSDIPGAEIRLFAYANDYTEEFDSHIVSNVSDVVLDAYFNSSDVIVYHFGIYYDHFDAILLGNGRATQMVYYHNVTPPELVPDEQRSLIGRSLRQRANISSADRVLAVSQFNKADLVALGIPDAKIEVCPLYVKFEQSPPPRATATASVQLLYVGRFVQSKGVIDLLEAVGSVAAADIPFTLRLVGNREFSDPGYLNGLRERIAQPDLVDRVSIHESVGDVELQRFYGEADIFAMPSYHEGFCVPVLEALHAGCIPIGYASGNLPNLIGQYGLVVPTGNTLALGEGLKSLARQFRSGRPHTLHLQSSSIEWSTYRANTTEYLKQFTFDAFARKMRDAVLGLAVDVDEPAPAVG